MNIRLINEKDYDDGSTEFTFEVPAEMVNDLKKIFGENYEDGLNRAFNTYCERLISED